MKENAPYLIIAILIYLIWSGESKEPIEITKTITITKDSIIKVPTDSIVYRDSKPIKVYHLDKKKEKKYNNKIFSLQDSLSMITTLLDDLREAKAIREYKEIKEDSLVITELHTKVQGKLLESKFKHTFKPFKVKTTHSYTETKILPKWSVYFGAGISLPSQFEQATANINLGFANKKGNIIELGYNSNAQILIGYKYKAFTKY